MRATQALIPLNPMKKTAVLTLLALVVIGLAVAQSSSSSGSARQAPELCSPSSINWKPGPGSLPPGAQFAVLEGDPAKDGPFTMRVKLPDGYKIPPHMHPGVEHITVLSGTFNLGTGDKFDKAKTQELVAGTFGFWPAGMKHFAWTKGETIVQLHGLGPWGVEYLNPADDPRKAAKK
jgi:hypothetical protein